MYCMFSFFFKKYSIVFVQKSAEKVLPSIHSPSVVGSCFQLYVENWFVHIVLLQIPFSWPLPLRSVSDIEQHLVEVSQFLVAYTIVSQSPIHTQDTPIGYHYEYSIKLTRLI